MLDSPVCLSSLDERVLKMVHLEQAAQPKTDWLIASRAQLRSAIRPSVPRLAPPPLPAYPVSLDYQPPWQDWQEYQPCVSMCLWLILECAYVLHQPGS